MKIVTIILVASTLILTGCGPSEPAQSKIVDYVEENFGAGYSVINEEYSGWGDDGCYREDLVTDEFAADFESIIAKLPETIKVESYDFYMSVTYCPSESISSNQFLSAEIRNYDPDICYIESRRLGRGIVDEILFKLEDKYHITYSSVGYRDQKNEFVFRDGPNVEEENYDYGITVPEPMSVVEFADAGFEKMIREYLYLDDEVIHWEDIAYVAVLSGFDLVNYDDSMRIKSLADLKWFINLKWLMISGGVNVAGDLSDLSGLTTLEFVAIEDTSIVGDISSFSGITNMKQFVITNNAITGDLSSVSGLTNLNSITFDNTMITGDISALSGNKNLDYLSMNDTSVTGDVCKLLKENPINNIYLAHTNVYAGPDCLRDFSDGNYDFTGTNAE